MILYKHRRDVKKTRKVHTCEACERPIARGKPAAFYMGEAEGEPYNAYFHPDCREAELAWNDANKADLDDFAGLWALYDRRLQADAFDTEAAATFELRLESEWPAVAERLRARALERATRSAAA